MGYRTLRECVADLEASGQLARVREEVDPDLEVAEIHRRVNRAGGPALLFERVRGCRFPLLSNVFGTLPRTRFLFRDTLPVVEQMVRLKADPGELARNFGKLPGLMRAAWNLRPKFVRRGPILAHEIAVHDLPAIRQWPLDGGAFVLLPQVYTEDPNRPGWRHSNLGMYRIQLTGGAYAADREIGLHYQIHRGIGVHHSAAVAAGVPLRVNIFVGGPPAMTLSAVMPLPEGFPELAFAGALGGRRIPLVRRGLVRQVSGLPIHAEADFCICGTVIPDKLLPEGPFGDHLGYYSLAHDFPVLQVEKVFHRPGAIWPFTIVGRPPQEDSCFGALIHELTGPVIPTVVAGVREVYAVDACGVHPLLLALGSERYTPYAKDRRPMELLTQAHAILGQGQMSLAKYLIIAADEGKTPPPHAIEAFLRHVLERLDPARDLHFSTCTTLDTLDYSGSSMNEGSKLVIAATGEPRRDLPREIPSGLRLPEGFDAPRLALPGVLVVRGPRCDHAPQPITGRGAITGQGASDDGARAARRDAILAPLIRFCDSVVQYDPIGSFVLIVIVDDSQFTSESLSNFLWVTFTRSDPASDVYGVGQFIRDKHWGCTGPIVIDARIKPHHAPPLEADPEVSRRVERLAAVGGSLHGIL